jgi:hypothetical protein
MCGLAGIIHAGGFTDISKAESFSQKGYSTYSNPGITEEDLLDNLLYLNTLRGAHSTGIFCTHFKENSISPATVFKRVVPATDFIHDPLYKKLRYDFVNANKAIIGHCRYATMGGLSIDAAHPHSADGITLVHNGTLNVWRNLTKTNAVSDSQAICHMLAESNNWEESLGKLDGAYALIWHNAEDGVIYVARNDERPLWYANVDGTIAISSEKEMLEFAVLRSLNTVRSGPIFSSIEFKRFEVGKLYGITPGIAEFTSVTDFTPYVKPPVQSYYKKGESAGNFQSSGTNLLPWKKKEEEAIAELEKTTGIKAGLDILFTPRTFQVYGYASNASQTGELKGRLVLSDGTESKVCLVKIYCLPNADKFSKCDILQGTINYVSEIYEGEDYKQGFRYRLSIDGGKSDVLGFVYQQQEDGSTVQEEILNSSNMKGRVLQ